MKMSATHWNRSTVLIPVDLMWRSNLPGISLARASTTKLHAITAAAGELAVSRYAHKEAIDHFTSALALTPESDTAARCELLLARETVYDWLGLRDEQACDLETLEKCAQARSLCAAPRWRA